MELIQVTFAANENKVFERAGRYFEVIRAPARVTVNFVLPSGQRGESMINALAGFYSAQVYTQLQITNVEAVQQTIVFMISDTPGGSRRMPGTISVVDDTGPTTQTQQIIDNAAGFGATAFVPPGSNARGIVVRSSIIEAIAAATFTTRVNLMGALTAPAAIAPGAAAVLISGAVSVNASNGFETGHAQSRFVPPGWGLYFVRQSSGGTPTIAAVTACYEIL